MSHETVSRNLRWAGLVCAAMFALNGHAAQYCITSDTALYSALLNASASAEDDEIRLVKGTMNVGADLDTNGKINGDLALRGGYDAGCATRLDAQAMTKINAAGRYVRLFPRQQSDITIERLDFNGFRFVAVVDNIAESPGEYGLVSISRSAFRNAETGLWINVFRHDVRIANSLFINSGQPTDTEGLVVSAHHNSATGQDASVNVMNCTVRGYGVGIWIDSGSVGPSSPAPRVVNSVSYGNAVDMVLWRPAELRYNIFRELSVSGSGALAAGSVANLSSSPNLDIDHRPKSGSIAINSGDNGEVIVPTKALDFYGNRRIAEHTVDRGAVESGTVLGGLGG